METEIPTCVGFIMDGNRRWASDHGLSSLEGHARGYEAFRTLISTVHAIGIPHIACYAFSTENWKRAEGEVSYLMDLFHKALGNLSDTHAREEKKINLRVIGERASLSPLLRAKIEEVEGKNYASPTLTVWIALSYGGRAEIVSAVNRAIERGEPVTETSFARLLWTEGMPDPDIIIRTSGEMRLSNFLLWQAAYSEFFFTECKWPDFGETEFRSILREYEQRQRRKGI